MFLISLMLAATSAPAVKPDVVDRGERSRPRSAPSAARSRRLAELEAAVASLPHTPEPERAPGPEGL